MATELTNYTYRTKVAKIEEKFDRTNWRKVNGESICDRVSRGWYLLMEGSRESIYIGTDKPDLRVGQTIEVILKPGEQDHEAAAH
jgi:hypothetical protein